LSARLIDNQIGNNFERRAQKKGIIVLANSSPVHRLPNGTLIKVSP